MNSNLSEYDVLCCPGCTSNYREDFTKIFNFPKDEALWENDLWRFPDLEKTTKTTRFQGFVILTLVINFNEKLIPLVT